jgi:choline kinase
MRAIICAAGLGSRMYPLAQDVPKSLLFIDKETIINRQIRLLRECGINDIIIVVGHLKNRIERQLEGQVTFCYNSFYQVTNSLFSVWAAQEYLTENTIITNADVMFTKKALEALINNPNIYCLLIGQKICNKEDHKVRIKDQLIIEVNKTMDPKEAFGEFVGLAKINKIGMKELQRTLLERSKLYPQAFWVSIFQDLIERGYEVSYALTQMPWIEIDTKEDYEEALNIKW